MSLQLAEAIRPQLAAYRLALREGLLGICAGAPGALPALLDDVLSPPRAARVLELPLPGDVQRYGMALVHWLRARYPERPAVLHERDGIVNVATSRLSDYWGERPLATALPAVSPETLAADFAWWGTSAPGRSRQLPAGIVQRAALWVTGGEPLPVAVAPGTFVPVGERAAWVAPALVDGYGAQLSSCRLRAGDGEEDLRVLVDALDHAMTTGRELLWPARASVRHRVDTLPSQGLLLQDGRHAADGAMTLEIGVPVHVATRAGLFVQCALLHGRKPDFHVYWCGRPCVPQWEEGGFRLAASVLPAGVGVLRIVSGGTSVMSDRRLALAIDSLTVTYGD